MGWGWLDVLTLIPIVGSPVALLCFGTLPAIVMLAAALLAIYHMLGEVLFDNATRLNRELHRMDDALEDLQRAIRDREAIQQAPKILEVSTNCL
jgi:hypothetical protein